MPIPASGRRRSTAETRQQQARAAALARHHGTSSREARAAARELDALALEAHIRQVVDRAPPLTSAQRDRLAALLRPTRSGAA